MAGTTWDGFLRSARGRASGARVPGSQAAPEPGRRGGGFGDRPGPEAQPQTVAPDGGSWESVFLWVHARLRA